MQYFGEKNVLTYYNTKSKINYVNSYTQKTLSLGDIGSLRFE